MEKEGAGHKEQIHSGLEARNRWYVQGTDFLGRVLLLHHAMSLLNFYPVSSIVLGIVWNTHTYVCKYE